MSDFNNIESTPLIETYDNDTGVSNVPGITSPSIDAETSVINIPEQDIPTPTPDLVWWTTDVVFSATDSDTVERTSGDIKLADWTSYAVDSGNTGNITAINYIYYDWTSTLAKTITPQTAVWTGKIMICVAKNSTSPADAQFQAFWTLWQSVFITADNIAANTITANEIAANTITATQMKSDYIYSWTIDADNITSGTITGRTLQTASSWQRVIINWTNNRIDFYNTDWTASWQIVWGKVGSTQVLALSSTWWIYSGWTHITQHIRPLTTWTYDLWWSTSLNYRNIYASSKIYIGNNYFDKSGSVPRRYNWTSAYYIPFITWASTNKTTNASIKVNLWWTEYYINVLAA